MLRRVELPGSRILTIRFIQPGDRKGLVSLYGSLSENDRYARFFTGHGPPKSLAEEMTHIEERGGVGLVAELAGPGTAARIVGEATVGMLENGNGELGITVDHDLRGWLGPYLLDALLEAAAARGIPNIEAHVLVMNRQMMSVLRHRGLVHVDHGDPAIAHVAISTRDKVPGWPPQRDKPRVLVEVQGGQWRAERAVKEAGFEVLSCPGPLGGWERCPALRGERCPLVDGADLVIDAVPGEQGADLLEAHGSVHPTVPVCIVTPDGSDGDDRSVGRISRTADEPVIVGIIQRVARGLTDHRSGKR